MRAAGFSETEIRGAESGAVVTRLHRLKDDNAAFVVGVARIASPRSSLVEQIRRIGAPGWRPANGRMLQAGRFGTPPRSEDLHPLVLEPADVRALKDCRVGDCDVQLSVRTMEEGHRIDWRAPGSQRAAEALLKSTLLGGMEAYLREGPAGLPVYGDGEVPSSVAAGLEYVLENSPQACRRNPPLCDYVLRFPSGDPPPGLEQFVFWSKVRILKPVVSLVHAFIQLADDERAGHDYIVLEHLYDSHYFLAYVEFMTLLPDPATTAGFYLIQSIRALVNPPRGWLRGILLGRIRHGMRDQLREDLVRTKRRLESGVSRR